jgi:multiple antibiotic resistance protein
MDMRLFGEVFVTLVVIMDPPGNVPIFLSVTRGMSEKERHRAALIATATALLVISLFALLGRQILDYLNVSIEALQGAGGLRCNSCGATTTTRASRPHPRNARRSRWCRSARR